MKILAQEVKETGIWIMIMLTTLGIITATIMTGEIIINGSLEKIGIILGITSAIILTFSSAITTYMLIKAKNTNMEGQEEKTMKIKKHKEYMIIEESNN